MEADLETINYRVIKLLKRFPETRNSDRVLLEKYYEVYEDISIPLTKTKTNPVTIWRCRQAIQAKNPLLRANEEVQTQRNQNAEAYKEFFVLPSLQASGSSLLPLAHL